MSSAVMSYSRWTSSNVMPPARLPTTTVFSSAFLRAGNAVSSSRPQKAGKSKLQRMRDEQISKTSCTWPGLQERGLVATPTLASPERGSYKCSFLVDSTCESVSSQLGHDHFGGA